MNKIRDFLLGAIGIGIWGFLSLGFLISGAFFLMEGFQSTERNLNLYLYGNEGQGEVIGYRNWIEKTKYKSLQVYAPILEYKIKGTMQIQGSSSKEKKYEIGEMVTILYQPENPSNAIQKDYVNLLMQFGVSIFGSLLFIIIGFVLIINFFRKE